MGVDGFLHDELHADGGGQVDDHIGPVDHGGHQRLVEDRVDGAAEPRGALERGQILPAACGQVVEHVDLMSGGEQGLAQVRADEPGASGDQYAHHRLLTAATTRSTS